MFLRSSPEKADAAKIAIADARRRRQVWGPAFLDQVACHHWACGRRAGPTTATARGLRIWTWGSEFVIKYKGNTIAVGITDARKIL
eukprot:gene28798-35266_t